MKALGRASDAPIVDSRLAEIAQLAVEHGGAAKPSGAGGGDVAVAFFEDSDAARSFDTQCADRGYTPLDVVWGAEGVRPY